MECSEPLTGVNCSVTWFDDLDPYSIVVTYFFGFLNVALALLSCFYLINHLRRPPPQVAMGNYRFRRKLLVIVLVGCILFETGHAVFFFTGMLMKYSFDEPLGKFSVAIIIMSWNIAFSTVLCTSVLLQMIMVAPVQASLDLITSSAMSKSVGARLLTQNNIKPFAFALAPVWGMCFLLCILVYLDKFDSTFDVIRVWLGILAIPLLLQGVYLRQVASSILEIIDSATDVAMGSNLIMLAKLRPPFEFYTYWMQMIFYQNGIMVLITAFTDLLLDEIIFFIIAIILAISLATVGALAIVVVRSKRSLIGKETLVTPSPSISMIDVASESDLIP